MKELEFPIKIPIKTRKQYLALALSGAFVLGGALMLITPDSFISPLFPSPWIPRAIGFVSMAFFGGAGRVILRRMQDPRPGLVLNKEGIQNYASNLDQNFVAWEEVRELKVTKVAGQKFLMVMLHDPEAFISRTATNKATRLVMKSNYKLYGSPFAIALNTLDFDPDDLTYLIEKEVDQRFLDND